MRQPRGWVKNLRSQAERALHRGTRLTEVLSAPGGLRAFRRTRPFSLSAFRLVHGLQSLGWEFRTIVDVGANAGQFSAAAMDAWPQARIIAFEPLAEVADRLRARMGDRADFEVHVVAVGAQSGSITFYPHEYSLSSSALPTIASEHGRPWGREEASRQVPLVRLDAVLDRESLDRPVLLKLDVQGLEIAVIEGATEILEQVDALLVEVAFERFYEGQPLFSDLHRALEERGWSGVRPLDWRSDDGRVVEADFLYTRP